MSDKKYVVPEGGLKAAVAQAFESGKFLNRRLWTEFFSGSSAGCVKLTRSILEGFIRWQAENPPKASMKQLQEMYDKVDKGNGGTYIPSYLEEWIRRMYLAPEPEGIPESDIDKLEKIWLGAVEQLYIPGMSPGAHALFLKAKYNVRTMIIEVMKKMRASAHSDMEFPEAIKDLLIHDWHPETQSITSEHNDHVLEAYRRGKDNK